MSCCDVNGLNRVFRGSYVTAEKKTFLTKGADARQRAFIKYSLAEGKSLLDIGCGVGAIAFTALQKGASRAQLVDVSQSYLRAAKDIAAELELLPQTRFTQGDFVTLTDLSPADLVTLDRVVCCYPHAEKLLSKAASLSEEFLIFTYPKPVWFMKLGRLFLNMSMRVLRNPYRFHLHNESQLLAAAQSQGHKLMTQQRFGIWQLTVCQKPS